MPGGGDAIGSGFVYRGKALPALRGKYIFTDISTGRIWYADYKEMLAADDGNPETHGGRTKRSPGRSAAAERNSTFDTMFPIARPRITRAAARSPNLPGRARVGEGRADAHVAVDAAGELYIFSKTDGMIRVVVGAR